MIKLQIEGQASQVQPFLYELKQRPHIDLLNQEVLRKGGMEPGRIHVTSYLKHQPNRRTQVVKLVTTEGVKIEIAMLDLIQVEIEEGVTVFVGRVFDAFA